MNRRSILKQLSAFWGLLPFVGGAAKSKPSKLLTDAKQKWFITSPFLMFDTNSVPTKEWGDMYDQFTIDNIHSDVRAEMDVILINATCHALATEFKREIKAVYYRLFFNRLNRTHFEYSVGMRVILASDDNFLKLPEFKNNESAVEFWPASKMPVWAYNEEHGKLFHLRKITMRPPDETDFDVAIKKQQQILIDSGLLDPSEPISWEPSARSPKTGDA